VARGLADVFGGTQELGVGIADVGLTEDADLGGAKERALGQRVIDDAEFGAPVLPERRSLRHIPAIVPPGSDSGDPSKVYPPCGGEGVAWGDERDDARHDDPSGLFEGTRRLEPVGRPAGADPFRWTRPRRVLQRGREAHDRLLG